jgi:hypothetical protein
VVPPVSIEPAYLRIGESSVSEGSRFKQSLATRFLSQTTPGSVWTRAMSEMLQLYAEYGRSSPDPDSMPESTFVPTQHGARHQMPCPTTGKSPMCVSSPLFKNIPLPS